MLIAKTLLLGLRLGRVVRNLERSLAHNLCDATAAATLRADEHRLMAAVCGRDVRRLMPVTLVPTPPKYFCLPRVVTRLPICALLPHTPHCRAIAHLVSLDRNSAAKFVIWNGP